MNDFYAYCRLVDDLADEINLPLDARRNALLEIDQWLKDLRPVGHPFWDRFLDEIQAYQIPTEALAGISRGVRCDLENPQIRFRSWVELEDYIYGVACCVGRGVLAILGANDPRAETYAQWMGRLVQYLNILRDLEADLAQNKIYVPEDFLNSAVSPIDLKTPRGLQAAREELYRRALEARSLAIPYSWRCLAAEVMGGIYLTGARKYWRHGINQRLSRAEKLIASVKILFQFSLKSF